MQTKGFEKETKKIQTMMENNSTDQFIKLVMILLVIGFVIIIAIILFDIAKYVYGQDADPAYYCMSNEFPFNELCNELKISEIMDDVLENAKRFNSMNDTEKCEIDESICLYNRNDPDLEDDGNSSLTKNTTENQ